jgi:hypothetical protein
MEFLKAAMLEVKQIAGAAIARNVFLPGSC